MNHPEVIQALKDLYQLDPCGPRWVETDDIEQAVYWAGRIGKGFLNGHVVTWDGAEFRIQPAPAGTAASQ